MRDAYIIMPVKDSIDTAETSIRSIISSGYKLTVYNDFSSEENSTRLMTLAEELHFNLINLSELTTHPSPNYLLILQKAQQDALIGNKHLIIIESDVTVRENTIGLLLTTSEKSADTGMVAAVTEDTDGNINFPYEYAAKIIKRHPNTEVIKTNKSLSFCCTLLSYNFLKTFDFRHLDPNKNWYDVTVSHKSAELGFDNLLMLNNRVIHRPHSSRPWKQLKYTNPLLYYWRKLTQGKDKI